MTLARHFNTLVCLAVLVAALSYCAAEAKPLLAAMTLLGVGAGWWAGRFDPPRALPRYLINLLVIAAILHAATSTMRPGVSVVSNLAEFLIYIQLIKLYDRRTPRDDGHALALSVFIVIGAILTSNGLGVGLLLLVYTPLAISAAMLLQLHGGHRAALATRPAGEQRALLDDPPPPAVGRGHRRDFRRAASFAVVMSLALAAAAFLLTPRGMGENLLGGFGKLGRSAVGFTNEIRLGQTGFLSPNDQTPVLDMKIFDRDDVELGDRLGAVYLRGAVHNRYHNGAWDDAPRAGPVDTPGRGPDGAPPPAPVVDRVEFAPVPTGVPLVKQRITLRRASHQAYIFTSWRPLVVSLDRRGSVSGSSRDLTMTLTPQRLSPRDDEASDEPGPLAYTVISWRGYTDGREIQRPDVDFDNERIKELAVKLVTERGLKADPSQREAAENQAVAGLVENYLRRTCSYTLEMEAAETGEDPIEMFLFRTRRGHCEYFASAMVALCQSVGLDARIVAGYLASEFNGVTGTYVVRQSNAHAWTEVNVAPGRWTTFDPSPPDDIARLHKPARGLLGRLKQLYDAVELTWVNTVVTFDETKRSGLVRGVDTLPFSLSELAESMLRVGSFARARVFPGLKLMPLWILPALAAGALVLLMALRYRRARRDDSARRSDRDHADDPVLKQLLQQASFYTQTLDALEHAGMAKPRWTPPLRHALGLATRHPDLASEVAAIARLYYQVRFGRRALSTDQAADAQAMVGRVQALLASGSPGRGPDPASVGA